MNSIWVVLPERSAEEAVRTAAAIGGGCGVVVTSALLAGPGPAVVAALAPVAPVLVLAGVHGEPDDAAAASRRYVDYGARYVTVQTSGGRALVAAVADAIGGDRVMAVTLWPGVDDAAVASSRLGESRGRVVSRLAGLAADAGTAAVLCEPADLGVVAQVAPDMDRLVWGVVTPGDAVAATEQGAAGVVLGTGVVAGGDAAAVVATYAGAIGRGE